MLLSCGGLCFFRERLAKIGRPLDPCFTASHLEATTQIAASRPKTTTLPPDHVALQGRSLTRRGRDWQHNDTLKARLEQYANAINKQLPHNPDLPGLHLTGQSLAVILANTLSRAADLQDVLLHLENTDPEAAAEVADLLPQIQEQCQDPSTDQHESTKDVDLGSEENTASTTDGASPGIHLSASCQRLFLNCVSGQHASAELSLSNHGTVAVQYQWRRQPATPHPIATPSTQRGQTQAQSCIHVLKSSGVLLPGATYTTDVMFKPTSPGA